MTKPPPKYGHRRIRENERWRYEWAEIPQGFNAWNEALRWNGEEDEWEVVPRQVFRLQGHAENQGRRRDDRQRLPLKPLPKFGHRRIFADGEWKYEWVGIPDDFNPWNQALIWDEEEEEYNVITRREREEQKRREAEELARADEVFGRLRDGFLRGDIDDDIISYLFSRRT
jgi:hypothetical protein